MTLVPLECPSGLNSDDTTFAAAGRWADCDNVRFWNGKPQVIGGWTARSISLPAGGLSDIFAWSSYISYGLAYLLTNPQLHVESAGTLYDITPTPLPAACTRWSLGNYGKTLMAVPSGGTLYQWSNNTALDAVEITEAPNQITAMLVTAQRQVLALGCNEEVSTTFNGLCIRGSDLEDPTDWTTSSTNNAFEHILEDDGAIVTARLVGDLVVVWTTTGVHVGQFVGDPSQTYRFDRVGTNCGLYAANAVIVAEGAAYWVTADLQFYFLSPGSPPAPMPCPISKAFKDGMSTSATAQARTFAAYNAKYREAWFFYPTGSSSGAMPTKYVAVSLTEGTWFKGTLTRTAMAQGPSGLIGGLSGNTVFNQETGSLGTSASPLTWSLQSADVAMDKGSRRVMISRCIPDFEDQAGDVSLTLYARDRAQSTAVTKGPYTLTTSTTKKDFRASGELIAFKFSGTDSAGTVASYMRLGKPLFDIVPMGER